MDCTSKLLLITLDPKFANARTKAGAIIWNVYEPRAINVLHCNMEKAACSSVLTDSSDHKEIKIFHVLVRYFGYKTQVKIKILELKSLPGEISVIVSNYLSDCLTENGLVGKFVRLCAGNTNSNFRGAERKRQNNDFTKLQKNLGHGLIGVWCAGHIFHNIVEQLLIFCLFM
jgi:hypothetical protein